MGKTELDHGIDQELMRAGLPALERSAWVEVDVDALTSNASILGSLARPAALGAVVKADGYGHGMEMAARCAVVGGARWLCVADSAEAVRLRGDGYEGRIFVLYPVPTGVVGRMSELGVDVTVGSVPSAGAIGSHVGPDAPSLAVHVEIDTGMTRGGVLPGEALDAATAVTGGAHTHLAGVWTHLAAPEDPAVTAEQLSRFASVLDELAGADLEPGAVHAAASGGLLATDASAHTFVRPGLAYYGVHPGAGGPLPPKVVPALTLKARPVRVAEVPAGTAVGYAGTWTAARPSRVATLPIGYADGWARSSSPGTRALVAGQMAPVVGRISSDALTIDVTDVVGVGDDSEFTLLGGGITADEVADVRGTISWEVLQQLGARLTRVYTSSGRVIAMRPESTLTLHVAVDEQIPGY